MEGGEVASIEPDREDHVSGQVKQDRRHERPVAGTEDLSIPSEVFFCDTSGPAEDRGKSEHKKEESGTGEALTESVGRWGRKEVRRKYPAKEPKQGLFALASIETRD